MINLQGKEPLCDQIRSQISRFIQLGILKQDDKLPSIRQLAQSLGINPNTVAKAYQQLENEGIVYTLNKKGVFVRSCSNRELKKQEMLKQIEELLQRGKETGIVREEIQGMIQKLYGEDDYA